MDIRGECKVEVLGTRVVVRSRSGMSLSQAASEAIAIAGQDDTTRDVVLEFSGTAVPIAKDDTIDGVADRYREVCRLEHEAFLRSPEGQQYQRQQEERDRQFQERQMAARRLLEELADQASFRFPANMPGIIDSDIRFDSDVRKQLLIGAQWLADNPAKKPFEPGYERDCEELQALMERTDTVGHSRMSFAMLMSALQTIAEQGFDTYVKTITQTRGARGR